MMKREVGLRASPIWLLGDSNPSRWQESLSVPLDPRHPIRHNIWTSILEEIQDKVYRERRLRLETRRIYIRNALADAKSKPKSNAIDWPEEVTSECGRLGELLGAHGPILLLSFGAFAFEFARRATGEAPRSYGKWGARALGEEFGKRVQTISAGQVGVVPLLHRSIAGGRFRESHSYFCGADDANYFEVVGSALANVLLDTQITPDVWVQ